MRTYQPAESQLLRRKQAAEFVGLSLKQFVGVQDCIPAGPPTPRGQRRFWVRDLEKWKGGLSILSETKMEGNKTRSPEWGDGPIRA
jgi:hypothetical protein